MGVSWKGGFIEAAGLGWSTVESLPVHDAIKRGELTDELVQAYGDSLRHLAAEGVRTVTYNFMPLLDWTRTDLDWELPDGATALRFDRAQVERLAAARSGKRANSARPCWSSSSRQCRSRS